MNIKHSDMCIEIQRKAAEFTAKYPKHCRTCSAAGSIYKGGTYWQPPDWDTCRNCLEQNKCPRCAEPVVFIEGDKQDYYKCTVCDWNELDFINNKPGIEFAPDPTCYCDEED